MSEENRPDACALRVSAAGTNGAGKEKKMIRNANGVGLRIATCAAVAVLLSACGGFPLAGGPSLEWVAGTPGSEGNLDGTGTAARFAGSLKLHADRDGGVLVLDTYASTVRHIDAQGRVTTLAGRSGVRAYLDGASVAARFDQPGDAVRAPDGTVYVADTGNSLVRAIRPDGTVATIAGVPGKPGDADGPRGVGQLDHPDAIALDGQGRLWTREQYSGHLRIVGADGSVATWKQPDGDCTPSGIRAIAASPDGAIWITDGKTFGHVTPDGYTPLPSCKAADASDDAKAASEAAAATVRVPPEAGPVAALAGSVPFIGAAPAGAGDKSAEANDEQDDPGYIALAFDGAGQMIAASARSIVTVGADGKPGATVRIAQPASRRGRSDDRDLTSLAIDGSGRRLVTTGSGEVVLQAAPDGRLLAYAGVSNRSDGLMVADAADAKAARLPGSVDDDFAVAADGTIYYVDRLDDAIYRIAPDGKGELWAGAPDDKGRSDGPRLNARFRYPSGLALDASGNLYVADSGNALIRRIDPQGNVQTVSGTVSDQTRVDGPFAQATFWRPRYLRFDRDGRLYVLDDSPYVAGRGARIRRLDFSTGTVTTVAREEQQYKIPREDVERFVASRRRPGSYEDLAIGPQGQLYVLSRDVIWQIDPATGAHRIHFLPGPWPAAEHAYYGALANAKSRDEEDRLRNNLISCDWTWCMPDRIAADASGNVYVSDGGNHTVLRIDAKGEAAVIAGQLGSRGNRPGVLPGSLNRPAGMVVTPHDDLFVEVGEAGIIRVRAPGAAAAQVPVAAATSEGAVAVNAHQP
ncbi:NHL repeat-containing protein [Burkholderia stabilis]